jgi:RNA polymerase sigma factor (sigma-70 family)
MKPLLPSQSLVSTNVHWFYPWLKKLSSKLLASENSVTLQPTALANEVVLKLLSWDGTLAGDSTTGLKRVASKVARQMLTDRGRKQCAKRRYIQKHAYSQVQEMMDERARSRGTRVLEIMDAVDRLRSIDPILGDLVVLRFFEGLDIDAAAEKLGLSRRTAIRRWSFAKAFLKERILFQETSKSNSQGNSALSP